MLKSALSANCKMYGVSAKDAWDYRHAWLSPSNAYLVAARDGLSLSRAVDIIMAVATMRHMARELVERARLRRQQREGTSNA